MARRRSVARRGHGAAKEQGHGAIEQGAQHGRAWHDADGPTRTWARERESE
jgi:hypothetical protein